jgi:CRISPR-associated protein Csd1
MILQSLCQLYERLSDEPDYKISCRGYSLQKIAFKVVLTPEGKLFDIQDARVRTDKGLRSQQIEVPGGAKSSGSGLNPCFLWDNTGYMLGYRIDDSDPTRTAKTFKAFREKHLALESDIGSGAFCAVCRFLEGWDPGRAADHPILAEITTGFGVFQILGETSYVHGDPVVRAWWERCHTDGEAGEIGQCLLTGKIAPIARLHEPKIKGVAGGKAEALLVSFNENAYDSYGKDQSHNAPVSEAAAFRYATALNALLDGPMRDKHRLQIGDATVAFWTDRPTPTEDIFAQFATKGSALLETEDHQDEALRQKLEAFLKALRRGREAYAEIENDPDRTSFFILGLSPNAARISVRFFHRATLSELLANLRRHFDDIRIAPQPAKGKRPADPEFPPASLLLDQTCPLKKGKPDREKIPPILAGPLLRAIVTGARYPAALHSAVIRRIHADHQVNYARVCVMKGFLTRNLRREVSMSLDTKRADPAYRLGRLFAALEKTQRDALENLNVTIRDRFYGSASATPRAVFPRLLRTYQHHLAKLEGGRKVNREKLVQEIIESLNDFPAHLNLAGQGLFALGYYHQTQDFYTSKQDQTTEL